MKPSGTRPPTRLCSLTAATVLSVLPVLIVPTLTTASAQAAPFTLSSVIPVTAGLAPLSLKGAQDLGAAQTSASQSVTLVLALRDQAGLNRLNAAQVTPGSSSFHHWLTPAQFIARFAPDASSVATATAFARSHGLTVDSVSANRTLVRLTGATAQINAAFGIVEHTATAGGQTYLTPNKRAALPAALARVTTSVLGLSTYNANTHPLRTRSADSSPYQTYGTASYGPTDFWKIYHAPDAVRGSGQQVGIITSGDLSTVGKDLVAFQQLYKLPAVPLVVVQNGPTSRDASGQNEYDLDSQYSSGFAPDVSAVVAFNSAALGDIGPLNDFALNTTVNTASASYGGCEAINYAVGGIAADDQAFRQMLTEGKSMFVSSGDEGSACALVANTGTPVGVPDVEYPSSSPYVTSVGGTSLTGQTTQPTREITWIGGGGGYSNVEKAPAWQASSIEFQSALGLRGLPDVSLDADPYSGFNVIVSGVKTSIGGTSASAPAWNGIWARVLQAHPTAGASAPALYAAHGAMVDITVGSNGLYAATPGYDLSTGLGSADITKLIATVR